MTIVVDASVWVAAADATDPFSAESRDFLAHATRRQVSLTAPDIARLEVACALARRLRDPAAGRDLGAVVFESLAEVHRTDSALLDEAVAIGTDAFLRSLDAIYAAVAARVGGTLVSWDDDLVARADAMTPATWLEKNPAR